MFQATQIQSSFLLSFHRSALRSQTQLRAYHSVPFLVSDRFKSPYLGDSPSRIDLRSTHWQSRLHNHNYSRNYTESNFPPWGNLPLSSFSKDTCRDLSSSTTTPTFNLVNVPGEESRSKMELDHGESVQSFVAHKSELENTLQDTVPSCQQKMHANQEFSMQPKASEHTAPDKEQVRGVAQQKDKSSDGQVRPYHPSATAMSEGRSYAESSCQDAKQAASESAHGIRRDADYFSPLSPAHRIFRGLDALQLNSATFRSTSSQIAEINRQYDTLSRGYELLQGKLQAKRQRLEEKDSCIRSLRADISALQRRNEEQLNALASARHELRSYQSQLDNVQRFISTADRHADQDIIQMLQGLNEEVYRTSMTMADYVAEGFARQGATAHQTKHISVGQSVFATIGQVMVNYLAAVENGDVALFLQIAFQGYLSHLLCHTVSSWTLNQELNGLIEVTYQKLRKEEPQAISGRWRSLTRTHILHTLGSNPKVLVECAIAGLSDVVMAAGLVSHQCDAAPKLSSEFGEKILSIVSHAGKLNNMVSEMISGDFEVFAVHPGATFDGKSMMDMDENKMTSQGAGVAQAVLCASRIGLRKQMGEKTTILTKAQVVLESFLA